MNSQTDRLNTALAGRYHIERELGQGGMATVYLAHDVRHDRDVAIKVLHEDLGATLGPERFLAEIKTTAKLQHPHILPLLDSGEAAGLLFYVMPVVAGETLRARLTRDTQLSIDDAVRIAREVADALGTAHAQGIVHRDIKPENILLQGGHALVADFGIALAVQQSGGTRMTQTGLSLGTPQYMAPEQAMGEKTVDLRADIYALGAVTYEMLTGDPPFTGSSVQAIVAKVMSAEPERPTLIRKTIPPAVESAVLTALAKLPADRFASAGEFASALATSSFRTVSTNAQAGDMKPASRWKERAALPLLAVTAISLVAATWGWSRPAAARPVSRYHIALPDSAPLVGATNARVALTPDGSLIYAAGGSTAGAPGVLWVRSRDRLVATRLPHTESAARPFVSPDGATVGYVANRSLWMVSMSGGNPVLVTSTPVGEYGGSWGKDGYIYFDGDGPSGLLRVRANGGSTPEPFTRLDSARGETDHIFPQVLPNGEGVLFVVKIGAPEEWEIAVADTKTRKHHTLVRGVYARFARSGHLLFVTASGTLMAAAFDQRKLQLIGEPVALSESVALTSFFRTPDLDISDDGTLVYSSAGPSDVRGEPVWVQRDGRAEPVAPGWTLEALHPALSPDGKQLALSIMDGTGAIQLWVRQLAAGTVDKLTNTGKTNYRPAWSDDSRSLVFVSDRKKLGELYVRRADATGDDELLLTGAVEVPEGLITRDGQWIVYRRGANSIADLYARRRQGDTVPIPLVTSAFLERQPAVSPDGRYLAYTSNETGQSEIHVRPFPKVEGGNWVISTGGGTEPRWSRDGKELFYRNGNADMIAVEVVAGGTPPTGRQHVLFSARPYVSVPVHQSYDVSPDGKRFVMIRLSADRAAPLVVVENFFEELKRKVPR